MDALPTEHWTSAAASNASVAFDTFHEYKNVSPPGAYLAPLRDEDSNHAFFVRQVDPYGRQIQLVVLASNTSRLETPETVQARVSPGWRHIGGRLRYFASLPHDWDGDGGDAPPPAVIESAQDFAAQAMSEGVPVPELYIDGGGEVGFRWRKFNWFASASFVEDGHSLIYIDTSNLPEPIRIDAPWSDVANQASVFFALKAFA